MKNAVHFLISVLSILIIQTARAEDRAPAAANPPAIPPAVPPGSSVPSADQPAPIKFSGFFDFRFSTFDAGKDPNVSNDHAQSGFGLEDAALYGNYEKDKVAFVMDLSFRRQKSKDNNATTPAESSESGNFGFALDKSQLYARYKAADSLVIDIGQFDTICGVELNDSKDRAFGKTGLVYDATLPVTHTGLMVEYSNSGFYGKGFAANPNNKGSNGTSTNGDESTEYGAALGFSNDSVRGQAGYMSRPITNADGIGRGDRTLIDVTLGTTVGIFSLDLEYALVNDPNKNKLTPTNASDSEDAGSGLMALVTVKPTEATAVSVRYEQLKDDPAQVSAKSTDSLGVSARYKATAEMELRTEYIEYNFTPVTGSDYKDTRYNAALLFQF